MFGLFQEDNPIFFFTFRFKSRLVRCLASATYILRQILSLGVTVYTPSVALATVIGIPYWASIVGMSAICILFTILVSSNNKELLISFYSVRSTGSPFRKRYQSVSDLVHNRYCNYSLNRKRKKKFQESKIAKVSSNQ